MDSRSRDGRTCSDDCLIQRRRPSKSGLAILQAVQLSSNIVSSTATAKITDDAFQGRRTGVFAIARVGRRLVSVSSKATWSQLDIDMETGSLAPSCNGHFAVFTHIYTRRTHDDSGRTTSPQEYALVDELPTIYKRFHWWTGYSDNNDTATDQRWEDINPAHGFIAMNREWALDNHWPDSMHLPSDDSKNVYLLEAYHMIHCLYFIRKTFWEAVNREEYTWNPPHSGHCFDALRQFIVCKADNTPLYTFGRNTAGDKQYRQCKDWNVLRDYATKHTACYRDFPKELTKDQRKHFALSDHFGYCDGGVEGIIVDPERKMHELTLEEFEHAGEHHD